MLGEPRICGPRANAPATPTMASALHAAVGDGRSLGVRGKHKRWSRNTCSRAGAQRAKELRPQGKRTGYAHDGKCAACCDGKDAAAAVHGGAGAGCRMSFAYGLLNRQVMVRRAVVVCTDPRKAAC